MTDTERLQQQITDALRFHRWKSSGDFIACACGHVPESSLHMEDHRASSLLPVVTAWAEQQARQRAAEELAELGRLLAFTPLSQRTSGVTSDYTQGMHAAGQMAASRADALTAEDPS